MADPLILCYHAVSDDWPVPYAVSAAQLEAQVKGLQRRGYRPATFTDAVLRPPAERTFAVTFDDGYRSVASAALPVLSDLGVPATAFVCPGFVGSSDPMRVGLDEWAHGDHAAELVSMTWAQIGELVEAGWEIGSHTRTHPRLDEIEDAALRDELDGSRADCERRLGRPCRSVAYPFANPSPRVVAAARAAGYQAGGGILGDRAAPGAMHWPRLVVYRRDASLRFRLKSLPLARRLRASRAWPR